MFFISFYSNAQDSSYVKWTLQKCIDYAKQNNITIKQSEINTEIAEVSYLSNKLSLLPTLSTSTNYGFNFGRNIDPTTNQFINQNIQNGSLNLSSSFNLFSGFRQVSQMRQGYYDYLSSKYTTLQTVNDVSLAVANAYLQIMYAKEQLDRSIQILNNTVEQKERIQKLFNAGSIAEGNVFEMEAQVAGDELTRITSENQYKLALLNLQLLLDLEKPISVDIPVIDLTAGAQTINENVDSIYKISEKIYPSVLASSYNLLSAEKGLTIARSARYPSLNMFANVSTNYSDAVRRLTTVDTLGTVSPIGFLITDNTLVVTPNFKYNTEQTPFADQINEYFGQSVGISLSWNIFNGWNTNSNVKRSKLQVLSAKYSYEATKNNLKKDISTAYFDAIAASKKYIATLQQVTALEKAFSYTQKKFEVGLVNTFDFNTAKKNLNTAASETLAAKYDYIFKLKVLDFYQGKTINLP